MHRFPGGIVQHIRLLGCSQQDVTQYLGWKSGVEAKNYVQHSDALRY